VEVVEEVEEVEVLQNIRRNSPVVCMNCISLMSNWHKVLEMIKRIVVYILVLPPVVPNLQSHILFDIGGKKE